MCLVVGFLFGLPALRLEGLYLALATFALGVSLPQLLKYKHLEHWTGGVQGIVIIKPDPPFLSAWLALNQDQWLYFFTLAVTVVMFLLAWNLLRGRIGRALVAIRDNHIAAEAMGINTALYKSLDLRRLARCTPASPARSARSRCSSSRPTASPSSCRSRFLIGIVVGGLASISGAIYGALFIQFVPNIADEISKAAPWAIYGLFLLALHLRDAVRRRRRHPHGHGAPAAAQSRQNPAETPLDEEETVMKLEIDPDCSAACRRASRRPRRWRRRSTTRARPTRRSRSATPTPTADRRRPTAPSARSIAAYFKKVNDEGGINGRKINFISSTTATARRRRSRWRASWSSRTRCC